MIEAQITELQHKLALQYKKLTALRAADQQYLTLTLTKQDLGPDADLVRVMTALVSLADIRFGPDERKRRLSFTVGQIDAKTQSFEGLVVAGDAEAVNWVSGVAERLKVKPAQKSKRSRATRRR
jgi:hypothetical protein